MEPDESFNPGSGSVCDDPAARTAVNSLVLDYYKKFGRKRDLEQYFSLSTAQSEIRDPSSLFWRRMKAQHDSSDSGEKPSESSTELCRISIKCSVPEPSSSSTTQEKSPKLKFDSESPPIIIEELVPTERLSEDESIQSEGNNSLKSGDATLDTSLNKPFSPTSSVTSQRKLEWDSLADVGYANESDRKASGSSLSTLERLALLQQYTNSDNKENSNLGQPSAHSTLLDIKNEPKKTDKKNLVKKTRELHRKDIDTVEVHVPHSSGNMPISVNLTKHISFNVEQDRGIIVESNEKENITINPQEKVSVETVMSPEERFDKEIQTSFTKSVTETSDSNNKKETRRHETEMGPVIISLNTIKRRIKRRKKKTARKRPITKKQIKTKTQDRHPHKNAEQVSEAESFEYMPGHIYNQNQMKDGNKSSLESSGGITTESSKSYSFTKELEKSIKFLNEVLKRHHDDSDLKKRLVKDVVRKLVKTNYRDDESATEFLSGLSFNGKLLNFSKASPNYTTTSTSDVNNSGDTAQRPKKSILRMEKFDSKALATNSQSAPNLPTVSTSDVPTISKLAPLIHLESDRSVDKSFIKTSSEEIYQKYLEALKKEEAYKRHIKDKGKFLKQKQVASDSALRAPEVQIQQGKPNKLKDLIKDLIRNNYDDGSGDASKLEGGLSSNGRNFTSNSDIRKQRSHSVFTLSSGNSERKCLDKESRKINLRKRLQDEIQAGSSSNEGTSKAGLRREHFCCCPHHTAKCGLTDSSTQVNIDPCQSDKLKMLPTNACPCKMTKDTGEAKSCYSERPVSPRKFNVSYTINRSSDFDTHKEFDDASKDSSDAIVQRSDLRKTTPSSSPRASFPKEHEHTKTSTSQQVEFINIHPHRGQRESDEVIFERCGELTKKMSQSSQTNVAINIFTKKLDTKFCDCNNPLCTRKCSLLKSFTWTNPTQTVNNAAENIKIHETTRCLQTEMSIDPKISDPQLHDIVIVKNQELAQVISEHTREVSRSKLNEANVIEMKYLKQFKNSETQLGTDTGMYTYLLPRLGTSDKSRTSCRTQTLDSEDKHDAASQSTVDPFKKLDFHLPSEFKINTDSYTIPLEGTNMTLQVSIGTKDQIAGPKTKLVKALDHSSRDESDPRINCELDQNTKMAKTLNQSHQEDTSRRTKCIPEQNTKLAKTVNHSSREDTSPDAKYKPAIFDSLSDRSSCKTSLPSAKAENSTTTDECDEDTSRRLSRRYPKYPTYPIIQKKQFLRTNTDSALLEIKAIGGTIETEPATQLVKKIRDVDTQANILTEDKSIETLKSNIVSQPFSEKLNCPEYPKPVEKVAICPSCNAYANSLENKVEKSVEATACLCQYKRYSTKLPDESQESDTKPNCAQCVKLLQKTIGTTLKPFAPLEDAGVKPIEDHAPWQCQAETIKTKSCETTPVVDAPLIDASDKTNCTDYSKPLMKLPGIPSKCNSCMYLDEKPEKAKTELRASTSEAASSLPTSARSTCSDPVIEKIQEITKRYGKKDLDKTKRKKCFNEIISVLNYLLETEDKPDFTNKECVATPSSNETSDASARCSKDIQETMQPVDNIPSKRTKDTGTTCSPKKLIDRAIQLTHRKSRIKLSSSDSSDMPTTSDIQECPTDIATCKILNKIKKECEKYHHKRCKSFHHNAKCESTSSTSAQCGDCKKTSHCVCRAPKCKSKSTSPFQRLKRKCFAYNLILQTSESIVSETQVKGEENKRKLENVVVKVPPRCAKPLPEYQSYLPHKYEQAQTRKHCPKSANEQVSATDDYKKAHGLTVKEYLEQNRPDFIESSSQRQNCLKMMEEHRTSEREMHRRLLSLLLQRQPPLSGVGASQLRQLARELGLATTRGPSLPKFISERDMKKHSEKIFKKLPEQVRKKEELQNENVKKTNLLMASIFKKNLQKKTLRGSVNLSNYNAVIQI